ncbi:MAG: heme o synthase [Cellvibrionaceae bacterium]|nr:heme o synthase [Cellvibrionaceae bacterium]
MTDSIATVFLPWRDYLALCKPKVVALMLLTSFIGMLLATPEMVPFHIVFWGNVGIALCAGSAAAINHLVDRRIDQKMQRTANRPLVRGRLTSQQALCFALLIGLLGMVILRVFINPLTAWLTLASLLGYALIYTLFLKRATPQNIVIGGIAGAAPPLLGWTAVTNSVDAYGLLLVLIIFAWTPPHFWALAVHRKDDYAKAGIPMLPVTHGEYYTKLHILFYTIILVIMSVLPYVIGMFHTLYLVGALLLGGVFLYWAVVMLWGNNPRAPMATFKYSIVYLMALFVIMLLDHYLLPVQF